MRRVKTNTAKTSEGAANAVNRAGMKMFGAAKNWTKQASSALMAMAFSAVLAGCVSFGGEDPPPSLLTLTPSALAPAGPGPDGAISGALAIAEPDAPARLSLVRVPVQVDDANIAYLKDAVWVEKPARLFRSLLAETIRTKSNRIVIDSDGSTAQPVDQLRGVLREFGYDARSQSVIVRFDAIRSGAGTQAQTRRFESVIPGVKAEAVFVGQALNRAANDVAAQVADWVS